VWGPKLCTFLFGISDEVNTHYLCILTFENPTTMKEQIELSAIIHATPETLGKIATRLNQE
jgi:hypothetical protein